MTNDELTAEEKRVARDIASERYNKNTPAYEQNDGGRFDEILNESLKAQIAKVLNRDRPEREKIAELEHEQWMAWAGSIIKTEAISKERAQRWQQLMIPYSQLTEEQKDQDRIWADKLLALFPSELR